MRIERRHSLGKSRGSALLIVLVLFAVMGTLIVSNTVALRRLKVELQLLEQKQQRALTPAQEATALPSSEDHP